jgi:hypothetical protein
VILLFTRPKNDRPLYKRDFLNACCDPIGAKTDFAYRDAWIPKNTSFEKTSGKAGTDKYQDALIVLCEKTGEAEPIFRYHPVRHAKIVEVSREHGYRNVCLELQEFFDYESAGELNLFQQYIMRTEEHPGGGERSWVRAEGSLRGTGDSAAAPWTPSITDFSATRWLPLVEHLRGLGELSDVVFFCVQETPGGPPSFLFASRPVEKRGATIYKVRSGTTHSVILDLQGWNDLKYGLPELKLNETVAAVSGPFLRQRSAGIEARFHVAFRRSFQQESSMLSLKIPTLPASPPASGNDIQSPQLQVLVNAGVSWGILTTAVLMLALGGLLAVITPAFVDEVAALLRPDLANCLKTNKLTVFILSKALSFVLLAGGTFLGFNKLPFK